MWEFLITRRSLFFKGKTFTASVYFLLSFPLLLSSPLRFSTPWYSGSSSCLSSKSFRIIPSATFLGLSVFFLYLRICSDSFAKCSLFAECYISWGLPPRTIAYLKNNLDIRFWICNIMGMELTGDQWTRLRHLIPSSNWKLDGRGLPWQPKECSQRHPMGTAYRRTMESRKSLCLIAQL